MQSRARGQGILRGHSGDMKNLGRTENKEDVVMHRGTQEGRTKNMEGELKTSGYTKMLWEDTGHRGGDIEGKGWRGPVMPWGHTKGDRKGIWWQ